MNVFDPGNSVGDSVWNSVCGLVRGSVWYSVQGSIRNTQ
jgi:hypothetical protein